MLVCVLFVNLAQGQPVVHPTYCDSLGNRNGGVCRAGSAGWMNEAPRQAAVAKRRLTYSTTAEQHGSAGACRAPP